MKTTLLLFLFFISRNHALTVATKSCIGSQIHPLDFETSTCSQFPLASKSRSSTLLSSSKNDNAASDRPSNLVGIEPFLNSVEFLTGIRPGEDDPDVFYIIGKINVDLTIAEGMPGLDLAAATELVLVSGVRGHAKDAGIQPGDTITRIRAPPDMDQTTSGESIRFIASNLMKAAQLAIEHNQTKIELELNRLVPAKAA